MTVWCLLLFRYFRAFGLGFLVLFAWESYVWQLSIICFFSCGVFGGIVMLPQLLLSCFLLWQQQGQQLLCGLCGLGCLFFGFSGVRQGYACSLLHVYAGITACFQGFWWVFFNRILVFHIYAAPLCIFSPFVREFVVLLAFARRE